MQNKKVAGQDNIIVEMLQMAGDIGIWKITELLNLIYDNGKIPENMGKLMITPMPKSKPQHNMNTLDQLVWLAI